MVRRVVEHEALSVDREKLIVVTIYEPGISKEQVKKFNRFSKRHDVLVPGADGYEWKN